jgi:hypothetical protein
MLDLRCDHGKINRKGRKGHKGKRFSEVWYVSPDILDFGLPIFLADSRGKARASMVST